MLEVYVRTLNTFLLPERVYDRQKFEVDIFLLFAAASINSGVHRFFFHSLHFDIASQLQISLHAKDKRHRRLISGSGKWQARKTSWNFANWKISPQSSSIDIFLRLFAFIFIVSAVLSCSFFVLEEEKYPMMLSMN